ncbi:MAG: CRISPR-associated endoribonuclease Cas6 [Candidatus Kapaibacteriota bacterium]
MRLKIYLKSQTGKFSIPINYNYALGAALYRIFYESSPEFAEWLHERGYIASDGRKIKMFTFSQLYGTHLEAKGRLIEGKGRCWFLFSSPFDQTIVENLVFGILMRNRIFIANREVSAVLKIERIEKREEPKFSRKMRYKMLSPTVVSIVKEREGKLHEYYLRVDEEETEKQLVENLKKKYEIVYRRKYDGELKIGYDKEYIKKRGGASKVSKLITIAEGKLEETRIRGFLCPVEIVADIEMQKVAYECGLGKKNGLGFGMLEVVNDLNR